jgi:hypothetical protein
VISSSHNNVAVSGPFAMDRPLRQVKDVGFETLPGVPVMSFPVLLRSDP